MAIKFFSIFFLLISFSSFSCELKDEIVSLSGPLTMMLEEFDLLEDKKLKAISTFHPIVKKTSAKVLAGGIFLSKNTLDGFRGKRVYFDKSRQIKKLLKTSSIKNAYEIDTVGKDVFETLDHLMTYMRMITSKCEKQFENLLKQMRDIKQKTLKLKNEKKMIFFLGRIGSKLPELVVVNDGVVLSLKKLNVLKTYESELSYVNWSHKQLKQYSDYLYIGINESKDNHFRVKKLDSKKWNIFYRGSLTPGIRQFYFLDELLKLRFH